VAAAGAAAIAFTAQAPAGAGRTGNDLRFVDRAITVDESSGRAVVQVQREATLALEETNAWFSTHERTAGARDFSEATGWLRLAVGQTTASIVVYIHDDIDDEPFEETFVVRLSTNAYGTDIIDEAVVAIRDDDDPPEPVERLQPDQPAPGTQPVAAAATPPPAARQIARPAARTNNASRGSANGARGQATARVTPFELRTPGGQTAESIPVPDHASPLAAAAFLAAFVLAKVSAEVWYRWRMQAG
jgi:hypothetical protein